MDYNYCTGTSKDNIDRKYEFDGPGYRESPHVSYASYCPTQYYTEQ